MGDLIAQHRPDLVVLACNTASTIVLPDLRKKFSLPIVGTVPAIKPACAASLTRRVSVLGTQATIAREYTRALIRDYAQGCRGHAGRIERARRLCRGRACRRTRRRCRAARRNRAVLCRRWRAHRHRSCSPAPIIPCCIDRLRQVAPWPVNFIDPAPAIARRVNNLLGRGRPEIATGWRPRHFHVGTSAGRRAGVLWHRCKRTGRGERPALGVRWPGLTVHCFPPKNRALRGPHGPARCFATRGFGRRFGLKPVGLPLGADRRRARSSARARSRKSFSDKTLPKQLQRGRE